MKDPMLIAAVAIALYTFAIFLWWRRKSVPTCPNCGGTGVPLSDAAVERCSLCVVEVNA